MVAPSWYEFFIKLKMIKSQWKTFNEISYIYIDAGRLNHGKCIFCSCWSNQGHQREG